MISIRGSNTSLAVVKSLLPQRVLILVSLYSIPSEGIARQGKALKRKNNPEDPDEGRITKKPKLKKFRSPLTSLSKNGSNFEKQYF